MNCSSPLWDRLVPFTSGDAAPSTVEWIAVLLRILEVSASNLSEVFRDPNTRLYLKLGHDSVVKQRIHIQDPGAAV